MGVFKLETETGLITTSSNPSIDGTANNKNVHKNLIILCSISSKELIALEIIWQSEGEGEARTIEELVTSLPNLKHL